MEHIFDQISNFFFSFFCVCLFKCTGWEEAFDENGDKYYVNHITEHTQWEHPSFGTTDVNTSNSTIVNSNTMTKTQSTQITNQFGTTNMQQSQTISTGNNNMNNNINNDMNMNMNMNQMNNNMINNMMQMNNQMMNNDRI